MGGSVIAVSGPPGAGKTTVARVLARRQALGVHLHTDDFWSVIVAGGIPPYEPASATQNDVVVGVIADAAFGYAAGGFTVVVDGVVGPWMLHHYLDRARDQSAVPLHYVVLRPGRDVTVGRAQARTDPGALTELQPVLAMWDQFADLGELEHHVLDTSDQDVDTTVESATRAVAGGRFVLRATR